MKVAYLTAGAGGMYCGSCMRDNALAAALLRNGRDVVLIPVYSPIRTDEPNVSQDRVYYGGINIYLQQKNALFRHLPGPLDRLLDHPSLLRRAMKKAGATSPEAAAPLTLSILKGDEGDQRRELAKLVEGLIEFQPDIVHLPNAFFVGLARRIKDALGVPVVCTLTGEDILIEKLPEPFQSETFALIRDRGRDVDAYLSVSRHYTNYARERFGLAPDRIHQVPLGIRVEKQDGESADVSHRPFTIGYLARICPDKGLHLLFEAFRLLHQQGRECRLKVAGYLGDGDRPYFKALQSKMLDHKLGRFIDYLGEVDRSEKYRMLRSIDVLSVPTVYREAKGLYVLEAMSQGVPVVQPRHGTFPEFIEATGGGLLCEPDDPKSLADHIARLMSDVDLRRKLGQSGRDAVHRSFTDEIMAERAWEVFESCVKVAQADPT